MGSFRSEPELTKHTIHEWSRDHSYAVCHMCGTFFGMQGGENSWKMQAYQFPHLHIGTTLFSVSSMAMEV